MLMPRAGKTFDPVALQNGQVAHIASAVDRTEVDAKVKDAIATILSQHKLLAHSNAVLTKEIEAMRSNVAETVPLGEAPPLPPIANTAETIPVGEAPPLPPIVHRADPLVLAVPISEANGPDLIDKLRAGMLPLTHQGSRSQSLSRPVLEQEPVEIDIAKLAKLACPSADLTDLDASNVNEPRSGGNQPSDLTRVPSTGFGNPVEILRGDSAASKEGSLGGASIAESLSSMQRTPQNDKFYDAVCKRASQRCSSRQSLGTQSAPKRLAREYALAQGWLTLQHKKAGPKIARRIASSPKFDFFAAVAILLNSLLLAAATDYAAKNSIADESNLPSFYIVADYFFSAWFVVELTMRVLADGPCFFWSPSNPLWSWNYFDTVVVGANIVEFFISVTSVEKQRANVTMLRMLRILRVSRAIRVIKLVRFFKELRLMILSILRSGTTLMWAMTLLAIIIFVFAIYLTQNVTSHVFRDPDKVHDPRLMHHFGTLVEAAYTLFLSVSGGISWVEVADPLFKVNQLVGMSFCFYIFFTEFAMLNIITGIFLDTAMRAAHSDKDECIQEQLHAEDSALRQIQKIFEDADVDDSGEINIHEFDHHLSDSYMRAHLAALGIEAGEAEGLFRLLDLDSSGTITIEEFLFGCMRLKGHAKSIDLNTLMYENKRMVEKWNDFFAFVEAEFDKRQTFEVKLEAELLQGLNIDVDDITHQIDMTSV